jgi:hypothetical protein
VHGVDIALGDLDDWASGATACYFRLIDLHDVNAFCNTSIDGGTGSDTLTGNVDADTPTTLTGGAGDDGLRQAKGAQSWTAAPDRTSSSEGTAKTHSTAGRAPTRSSRRDSSTPSHTRTARTEYW